MDAKTLRASILQMAIEGKLVPQLDEEPAVEQIGDAPEEVPFEIPGKWKWITVGDACTQISTGPFGSVIHKTDYSDDGVPIVNPADMRNGCISTDKIKKVKRELICSLSSYVLKAKDIVIARRGDLGRCAVVRQQDEGYLCGTGSFFLHLKPNLSTEYFVTFFSSDYVKNKLTDSSVGTTMANLNHKILKGLLIPVPPLSEQSRIIARLNELLPLVDKFGKAQEALAVAQKEFPEKLKASLLQEAIQGKLVPQLDEEPAVKQIGDAPEDVPFAIPEKWKWVQCDEVVTFNPRIKAQDETEASFIPMPAVSAGFTSTIDTSAIKHWKQIKNGFSKFSDGDVLFAKITPCFQNRKSVVCKNLSNGIGAGSTEFHVLRPSEKLLSDFLLFFLKSPYLIKYGMENLRGTAGQQRFSTADLKACLFPLPPIEEQRRIVARLNELLPLVTKMAAATAN